MSITIKELRTEFTANTQGLAAGVAQATVLLQRFGTVASAAAGPVLAARDIPARLPQPRSPGEVARRVESSPPKLVSAEPAASVSVINNWPALTDDIVREKILPQIEQAIRNGKIKPFKLGNAR